MSVVHPFQPLKLLWHRDRIELMRAGVPTSAPIDLEWDLSNHCPHDCPFCSFGTSESQGYRQQVAQHFPEQRALTLIPEMAAAGVEAITFTGGGEPLVHPRVRDIMLAVRDSGIAFGLVTNGFLLRGNLIELLASNARFVRVSLDAGLPETHEKMHRTKGPQFETILKQIGQLVEAARLVRPVRATPLVVGASFCVTDSNWHEIGIAVEQLHRLGADYLEVRPTFPTTWRGDGWGDALRDVSNARRTVEAIREHYLPLGFKVIGMVERFESLDNPTKRYSKCRIGPLMAVLGADGRLWHCCVQRGQDGFDLGSVLDRSFADAWAAAQARKMADWIEVGKCPRCRYDNYNELLEGLESDALHASFV